jgi:beta-fructofuranosidase
VLTADPAWYEKFGTSSWPEEAWRDPWVFADPAGNGWHMLVTARVNEGDDAGRGVVGHAISHDLATWRATPPLSEPQQGFAHLEVPQALDFDGHPMLLFCCNSPRLSGFRRGQLGGIWVAPASGPTGPFAIEKATLLAPESLYAGRMIRDRTGRWVLLAFQMENMDSTFEGSISDPIPLAWDAEARTIRIAGGTG